MKISHLIACSIVFALSACGNKRENASDNINEIAVTKAVADEASTVKMMSPAPSPKYEEENRLETNAQSANSQIIINKQKIIKDGNITIKSEDIHASKRNIDRLVKKLNAYYEGEDLQNNEQSIAYHLKIRIPSVNFEKLITSIENGKDEIKSKNILARDVTEEYVDIEGRLSNKRDYLKRYKEILLKASTVKDLLAIEENIRNLQEEIESQQGRLNFLKDQVAFSTLNIELYKQKEYIEQPKSGFLTRTKVALNEGWQSIIGFVLWAVSVWPCLILLLISYIMIRRMLIFRRRNTSVSENANK